MFTRILAAIEDYDHGQSVLELVKAIAVEGKTQVCTLHLRERELSGNSWYMRESSSQASFVSDSANFELRMAGLAAGGEVRPAVVDRVAEAILSEAGRFGADLIVLGPPSRREWKARLFGSVTQRVIQRAQCPVIVAARRGPKEARTIGTGTSAPGYR